MGIQWYIKKISTFFNQETATFLISLKRKKKQKRLCLFLTDLCVAQATIQRVYSQNLNIVPVSQLKCAPLMWDSQKQPCLLATTPRRVSRVHPPLCMLTSWLQQKKHLTRPNKEIYSRDTSPSTPSCSLLCFGKQRLVVSVINFFFYLFLVIRALFQYKVGLLFVM